MSDRQPRARAFPLHHGRVSLSFAGTVSDRGSQPSDRLDSPAALAQWLLAAGVAPDDATVSVRTYKRALQLREAIARVTRAVTDGAKPAHADVHDINDAARRWASRPALDPDTLSVSESVRDPVEAALGRVARDAIELLGDAAERARLRGCALSACATVFLTPAKGRERRWCSMARCGNRSKVASFRERARQA